MNLTFKSLSICFVYQNLRLAIENHEYLIIYFVLIVYVSSILSIGDDDVRFLSHYKKLTIQPMSNNDLKQLIISHKSKYRFQGQTFSLAYYICFKINIVI